MAQFINSTLLRLRQVLAETGDSRSWLYQRIADRQFTPSVKCGGISKWPAREVALMNEAEIAGRTEAGRHSTELPPSSYGCTVAEKLEGVRGVGDGRVNQDF